MAQQKAPALSSFRAPIVEIEAFDPPAKIVFDANAFERVEEKTGENALEAAFWENTFLKPKFSRLKMLIWAGCATHQPDRTLEEIGSQIHVGTLGAVRDAIEKAYSLQAPGPDERPTDAAESAAENNA